MKQLNGSELAGFIQQRQAQAVRALRQAQAVQPKLAIVVTVETPVIELYMKLKRRYGETILVDVEVHRVDQAQITACLKKLNADPSIHGIIVQLPLADPTQTDTICNLVAAEKDVDALGDQAQFDPATPLAILWLLAGYNVDLKDKKVVLVGRGKLVGRPLERMLKKSGVDVVSYGSKDDVAAGLKQAEVIITATGQPGVLTSSMIPAGAVVVDAGVAGEGGKVVGDLADDVYGREDLTLTPKKGGVGPLTICALFENVIQAAKQQI